MNSINICVTVFNRYDLLKLLVDSIRKSIIVPTDLWIIDRGHDHEQLLMALGERIPGVEIHHVNLDGQCLAAAWNWFIKNVPEDRILASDDIIFYPETIGLFVNTPGEFVGMDDGKSSSFACFLIRDSCVEKVGLFDEQISPDYLYFEDCDYGVRMHSAGVPIHTVKRIIHANSQSLVKKTDAQKEEHNRRFLIAQENFVKKWGRLPAQGEW